MAAALLVVLALIQQATPSRQAEFTLENGMRVTVLEVSSAPRQSTFTFLPLGLLRDDLGRPQFSHLLEHMLIRSTDRYGQSAEGILMNGETMAFTVRLETIAPPDQWESALDCHVRWLHARRFDAKILEAEKKAIGREETNTVAGGHTHKWAQAAWHQVVTHGQSHVRLHGAVASATLAEIAAYARSKVRLDGSIRLATIGPAPLAQVKRALLARFPRTSVRATHPDSRPPVRGRPLPRNHVATWDLAMNHLLLWYPVPSKTTADRVSALCLCTALSWPLLQNPKLKKLGVRATASPYLQDAGGRYVSLGASFPAASHAAEVRKILETIVRNLFTYPLTEPRLIERLGSGARTWRTLPDFRTRRKYWPKKSLYLLEGQLFLDRLNQEIGLDARPSELAEAHSSLNVPKLEQLALKHLRPEACRTLLLTPGRPR